MRLHLVVGATIHPAYGANVSIKNNLKASGQRIDQALGGAHLTHEARRRTINAFSEFIATKGATHIRRFGEVKGKDLRDYVRYRLAREISKRTLQNELSHLRTLLREDGAHGVANAPELSNANLGIGGTRRAGTKGPATNAQLEVWCGIAESTGRAGIAAMLRLCRFLGLRGNEALHVRADTLVRWKIELNTTGEILVAAGTKGGRKRTVKVLHPESALHAIEFAKEAMASSDFLITRANLRQVEGLKQARSIWHSWVFRHGIKPHSLRYAFAHAQFAAYIARNFSEREALASLSLDLGHGDGRGRWVKSVYLSGHACETPVTRNNDAAITGPNPEIPE